MHNRNLRRGAGLLVLAGLGALSLAHFPKAVAQANGTNPPAVIPLKPDFDMPAPDAQSQKILAAATNFLDLLSAEEKAKVIFPLDDDAQRSNWSNLPDGIVQRKGLRRQDLSVDQLAALDGLLGTILSAEGMQNIRYQLFAEDQLGGPRFSSGLYYVSFLGAPSADTPWMLQFGGHHLALNVTVFGPDLTFSPMLTGGQPLHISYDGADVYITETETRAAKALLESLSEDQRKTAVRSSERASLLLGPGTFGTSIAPEGVKGSDMSADQRALLVDVISTRLGFMNNEDFTGTMDLLRGGLDDTYFGWWGPQEPLGAGYFRITGPRIVMEYAPQELGGDVTDHAHSIYRDPTNDYGSLWIAQE